MKPGALAAAGPVILLVLSWVHAADLLEVGDQNASGLTLTFETRGSEDLRDGEGRWAGLRLPGFASVLPGSLGLAVPARSYLVGIPVGSEVICEITDPTYYDINNYDTDMLLSGLGQYLEDIPEAPAEITLTGFLRDQRVAGLRIAPVVYDRSSETLRVFKDFKVRLEFRGGQRPAGLTAPAVPDGVGADEAFYRRAILNYGQARPWRRRALARAAEGDYFSDSSDWLKIRIDTTGIYCITGRDLEAAGVAAGTVDADLLRLYTGGGLPLVESLSEYNPDWMRMVAVKVVDDGDGRIGRSDSIIFYGLGMYDWANYYGPGFGIEDHYGSFYSDHNYYWLTWGGTFAEPPKRMEAVDAGQCEVCPDCSEPESFLERVRVEEDWRYNFSIRADDGWYWRILNFNSTAAFTAPTSGLDPSRDIVVKMRIGDDHLPEDCRRQDGRLYYYRALLTLNHGQEVQAVKDTVWLATSTARDVIDIYVKGTPVSSETQNVQVYLPTNLPPPYQGELICSNKPTLAWYDVYYWRRFVADGRQLFFLSPGTAGMVKYDISGFGAGELHAFDLTDQFNVREITGLEVSGGPEFSAAFCDTLSEGDLKRYAVISPEAFLKPAEIARANIDNIRYATGRPYCVITHEDLEDAGRVISQFRDAEMVTVGQIYDEFGWGVPDVTAIRDFLRWRYDHGALEHVLLLGDATWDFKGYLTGETFTNYVPSYERRYRVGGDSPYNTDDWYVYLATAGDGRSGPDTTALFPTVSISRLAATSPETAEFLVEQIMNYESDREIGPWQNRVIMVADDDRVGSKCDDIQQGRHIPDMEAMSDNVYPEAFERVKIYLTEYPRESTGLKPAARDHLVRSLNQGALVTNYVGHGDPRRWAQEEVFNNTSVELVAAGRRQSLLIASSCNVSKFDEPTFASIAERLLLRPEGGMIASFASTHYCQAAPNRYLNENFVRLLFESGLPYPTMPVGDAAAAGKALAAVVNRVWQYNSEMYSLLGDPRLELAVPVLEVRFDAPIPDTLNRKGVYDFAARVYEDGQPADGFQGKARVFVRESDDTAGYVSDICFIEPGVPKFYDYELPGAMIFRGKSSVENASLGFSFFVASGAREGAGGNIRCFVTDGLVSGVGLLDSLPISGESIVDDLSGPEVSLESAGGTIGSGDTVLVGQAVEMILLDESGVAVKGKSESIPPVSVVIDEVERIGLGDSVYSVNGDFKESRVWFEIPQLAAGEHRFGVTAFDNLNNSTTREYDLVVGQPGAGAGNLVYVYPNPTHDICYIIWEYENDSYIEVEVTVYTLAGRKIWTGLTAGRSSQHMIEWDGRDFTGEAVANGTYLAVVEARAPDEPGFETKDTIAIAMVR